MLETLKPALFLSLIMIKNFIGILQKIEQHPIETFKPNLQQKIFLNYLKIEIIKIKIFNLIKNKNF